MTPEERFEAFWRAYPRRVGKLEARRVFVLARVDDALLTTMLEALAWQIESAQWKRGFVPHPATWLRQGRYLDEPFEVATVSHPKDFTAAADHLRRIGGCPHEVEHSYQECVRLIALARTGQTH